MAKHDKVPYLPKERGYFELKPKSIKAYSEKDFTELPDPVRDPIVSNDIATWEFNYTFDDTDIPE